MSQVSTVTKRDIPSIVTAKPLEISSGVRIVLFAFVLIGIAGFAYELMAGDVRHAWVALQVNFIFWFCMAAASTCFSSVLHVCNAQWVRPIRRIFESASIFFYISPIFLVIIYFGHGHLFEWAHHEIPGKGVWLTSNFLYARDILAILILAYMGGKVVKLSIRRDIVAIRGGLTGLSDSETARWKDSKFDCYVANSLPDAKQEIEKTHNLISRLSPAVIIFYAVIMTLIAVDQEMSVDPLWYSTMFGGFVFMGAVYLAMAWCSMGVVFTRALHPLFVAKIHRSTLHDLGKLLFGFGIFWAYLFWSHYLPIWYGNMPEETGWIITRLRVEPWHKFAWVVLGSCWILPFFLGLNRDLKQVPAFLFFTASIVAVGLWLQHYLLFVPTLYPHDIPLGLTDLTVTIGFAGVFLLCAATFMARVPLIPFGDLYLEQKH